MITTYLTNSLMKFILVILVSFLRCLSAFSQVDSISAALPNILWITCEDMSPDIAPYQDSTVITPAISRLAQEGITFTNAYTTSGVCAPSRAAIITGMYATSINAHNMSTKSGARAGLINYQAVPPPQVKCFTEYLRARKYYCTNNEKTDYQFGNPLTAWDECSGSAHWRNRPPGQPFFSVFNIMHTHESEIWRRARDPLRVDPLKVKVPPYFPVTDSVRIDIARYYDNIMRMDSAVAILLAQLEEDGLLDKTIVFFFSDHGAGLPWYKREIYTRGVHIPLIVRFPDRDAGGTKDSAFISTIDLAPTVLSLGRTPIPSHLQGQPFLGDQKPASPRRFVFAARDRMDEYNDMARAVKDNSYTYVRNYQPAKAYYQDLPYRKQMPMMREILRMRENNSLAGYIEKWFNPKASEELYDNKQDPFELNNLALDPAHHRQLELYRSVLAEWTIDTNDMGFIPERDLIEMMWPDGRQPVTSPPELKRIAYINKQKAELTIECDTPGASIAYQKTSEKKWHLYSKPIELAWNSKVKMRAIRYGYKASKEVVMDLGEAPKK